MNVCWPFFSIIKLYVQFTWQSQTSLCAVMCWPFGSACEKVPGLPAPKQKQAQIRDSWQVLQQVRFALAEKADVSLLLRQCCFTSGICTPQIMLAISLVANVCVKMLHVSIRVTELQSSVSSSVPQTSYQHRGSRSCSVDLCGDASLRLLAISALITLLSFRT